ncbi:MAG: hypothetical protein M0Q22_06765 [Sulfuritalea sp.]|jgi:hypothetical protein|nr:hypothetical protein [Sulfuritalea sp.]
MKIDLRSIYRFHPIEGADGLPSGGDVYYECECGDIVSSVSFVKAACKCGNVAGGHGSVTTQSPEKVKPLRGKLR